MKWKNIFNKQGCNTKNFGGKNLKWFMSWIPPYELPMSAEVFVVQMQPSALLGTPGGKQHAYLSFSPPPHKKTSYG